MKCKGFSNIACINGNCPNAEYEAVNEKYGFGIADDMGLETVTCSKCYYNTGNCKDCMFEGTEDCDKGGKNETIRN